jgi:meiosis-specific APC/C activator protein AMA1
LAVGLHSDVYSWDEVTGARAFVQWSNAHVTSLAFSSAQGKNSILAIGRISGSLTLWDPSEKLPRFEHKHLSSIACLAWKPKVTYRAGGLDKVVSEREKLCGFTEDLLLGDEAGTVHLIQVTWGNPKQKVEGIPDYEAKIQIIRRIVVHTQQICGLAWSPDGTMFASGGNDNAAFLFDIADIEGPRTSKGWLKYNLQDVFQGTPRHRWEHAAAVKAIAFCPWQRTLVATGIPPPLIFLSLDMN